MSERKKMKLKEVNTGVMEELANAVNIPKTRISESKKKTDKINISIYLDSDLLRAIRLLRVDCKCNLSEVINKHLGQNLISEIGRQNISNDILTIFESER
jgi:hypothetical protein